VVELNRTGFFFHGLSSSNFSASLAPSLKVDLTVTFLGSILVLMGMKLAIEWAGLS